MFRSSQQELVKDLRKEAHDVKECAVQYFVRSVIFVSAYLGVIVSLLPFTPYVSLASILVLPILFANTKILLHKYGTANRNLGYELHLERSQHFKELYNSKESWSDEYGDIGWEEAMRAWRIVQATVFESVCDKKYNNFKKEMEDIPYPWFNIKKLIKKNASDEGSSYYASSFLKHMIFILNVLMVVALVPLAVFIGTMYYNSDILATILASIVLVASILYIVRVIRFTGGRRKQLEYGLLSISSCSVLWHAVILAHFRALDARKKLKSKERVRQDGYAYNISIQASRLASQIGNIHEWIEGKWLRKDERSVYTIPRKIKTDKPSETILEVIDHSSGGMGALIDSDSKLNKGDNLVFQEEDLISGILVYKKTANESGKDRIGVQFLASPITR